LYDIYSNQSYTCVVEMMGCAYIQPLMYFVLLNVPFFRGSYLISKVKHRMSPGNMVTEVTGVRMSKYSNKIVEDMFTDEMDEQPEGGASSSSERSKLADTSNDCPYSVFPIGEDDGISMTNDEGENANNLMKLLMNNGANRIVAAGIVGNMAVETGPTKTNAFRFNPQALVPNDSGYVAAGLVMWNDSYYSLQQMLNNEYKEYGHKTYKSHYVPSTAEEVKKLLANKTAEYQCKFIVDSLKNNNNQKEKKLWAKLMEAKTAREAAHIFCNGNDPNNKYAGYENPNPNYAKLSDRMDWADKVYKAYSEGGSKPASEKPAETDKVNNPTDYAKLFVAAIQKSLNSTERYAGELNPVYGNEGLVTITMKDNSSEKLAVLFDIILNSETYYNQVFGLQWRYKTGGAPNELPFSLAVTVKPNVDQNMRRIFIHDGTPKSMNGKLTGEECNERFMQSLGKKYGSNKDLFVKECPQFSNSRDCLDKYKPADCNTLFDNTRGSVGTISETTGFSGEVTNEKMKKVLSHVNIFCHAHNYSIEKEWYDVKGATPKVYNKTGSGWCTYGPSTWYAYSDVGAGEKPKTGSKHDLHFYPGPDTATYSNTTLRQYGFKLVWHGTVQDALKLPTSSFRPGDVCTQYYMTTGSSKGENKSAHGCMWTGKDWRSDFVQGSIMANRKFTGRDGNYSVCIWRNPEYQEPGMDVKEVS
jgi:hypothetical protein